MVSLATRRATASDTPRPGLIAFSVRRWDGEYQLSDVPGGVQTTPAAGSIQHQVRWIRACARSSGRDRMPTPRPSAPTAAGSTSSPASGGTYRISRCRTDGSDLQDGRFASIGRPILEERLRTLRARDGRFVFTVHDGQIGHVAIAGPDGSQPRVIAPRPAICTWPR